MMWQIDYYNVRVAAQIENWPAGVRASFLRIAEMMMELGPDIGMPHTRAMGGGLFEVRAKGARRYRARVLLHMGRPPHRNPARHHQEDGKDPDA